MKEIIVSTFVCEICGESYDSREKAESCESRPISGDKGVKVGDIVLVTSGEGKGYRAKVKSVTVVGKDWGHYDWKRYWHTVVLSADLINTWGSRSLTFDNYEVER